ncbi:PH domain-containing protein [Mesoplasma seiffertii]|uniref:PH domain-containing protein n=1 Tax=Mesoplasma seiffertii TaxID=28224 RepID=UPI00047C6772|nr:PH domain-containing protein [Mesoplasma seiffertii]
MKSVEEVVRELIASKCSNSTLTEKKEFETIRHLIHDSEKALCLIVGLIDNDPWLILLSDQRIIMVQKQTETGSIFKQYGLEQVKDLRLDSFGEMAALTFIFEDDKLFKADYLSLKDANEFGRLLVKAIEIWTNKLNQFLI